MPLSVAQRSAASRPLYSATLLVASATVAAQTITLPPNGDNQRSEVIQQIGLVRTELVQQDVELLPLSVEDVRVDELQGRVHDRLAIRFGRDHDVGHLVHRASERLPRVRARMTRLLYAQLEQRAIVVDERARLERVLLVALERQPVGRVVGKEIEPGLELPGVEETRLVI